MLSSTIDRATTGKSEEAANAAVLVPSSRRERDQGSDPSMSVVIPTYRRPAELVRCLRALEGQTRAPDEIIVVHRLAGDSETAAAAAAWSRQRSAGSTTRRVATVDVPGVIAAMETGVRHAAGDVVVFLDDDVEIHPDWLERAARHYADPSVVGVGGRDIVSIDPSPPTEIVGIVTWYGKAIGNHQRGHGPARQVDTLKGANMSMRRAYCVFDHRLRGSGAQVHWEMQLCLKAGSMGQCLIYDPNCIVDHYPAQRFGDDQRGAPLRQAITNTCHNETYVMMTYLRWWQRIAYFLYVFVIGHRSNLALVRWGIGRLRDERLSFRDHLVPSYQGKTTGLMTWLRRGRAAA